MAVSVHRQKFYPLFHIRLCVWAFLMRERVCHKKLQCGTNVCVCARVYYQQGIFGSGYI